MIDFSPLCPPADPRARARSFAERQLHFVDDTSRSAGSILKYRDSSPTASPLRFMNVSGLASSTVVVRADRHLRDQRLDRRRLERRRRRAAPARRPPRTRRCAACRGTSRPDCRARRSASWHCDRIADYLLLVLLLVFLSSSSSSSFLPFLMTSGSAGAAGAAAAASAGAATSSAFGMITCTSIMSGSLSGFHFGSVGDVADAHALVQHQLADVDLDVLRNVGRQALDLDLAADELEDAALLLHALRLALDDDRDRDAEAPGPSRRGRSRRAAPGA